MSVFTICENLVRRAAAEQKHLANVLHVFLLDVPIKIAIDEPARKILEMYAEIAAESHEVANWLDLLGKVKGGQAFEHVRVHSGEYGAAELFVKVCAKTVDNKMLLCWSKQDYAGTRWRDKRVTLADGDEARALLRGELGKACGGVQVMGDVFAGIRDSTIVSRSKVEKSFNRVKEEVSPDVAEALVKVAEAVAASGNRGAGVVLDAFNQELAKKNSDKGTLRSYWESLVRLVPDISGMVDVAGKVAKLFADS